MSIFQRFRPDERITQSSGLTVANLGAIALDLRMSSYYSAGANVYDSNSNWVAYGYYGEGDIKSISVKAAAAASAYISAYASGSVGNLRFEGAGSAEIEAYLYAGQGSAGSGDIGDIVVRSLGVDSSGYIYMEASGNIGQINMYAANPDGELDVSAYAYSGDIAGLNVVWRGGEASGDVDMCAYGGDIGFIRLTLVAASADSDVSAYASAIAASDGTAVGGNIGDITVNMRSVSGEIDLYASAFGLITNNEYIGGGDIGDINIKHIVRQEHDSSHEYRFDAYSGGSIGTFRMHRVYSDSTSASANVSASAHGAPGHVVSIGDIDYEMISRRGQDMSAYVKVEAGEDDGGGNIGDIRMIVNEIGGGSTDVELYASAFSDSDGSGGNIGDIRIVNTGYDGNSYISLHADKSIGQVYIAMGPGSSDAQVTISGSADVGDITMALHSENMDATQYIDFYMNDAESDIGLIQILGGSFLSKVSLDDNRVNSIAGIDMARYAGSAYIELGDVHIGTTIIASRGDAYIEGTTATDNIRLGAGEDEVYINSTAQDFGADFIYDLEVLSDFSDQLSFDFNVSQHHAATSSSPAIANPSASSVADGDLLRLVDIAAGNDILTSSGLLAALNGGEYDNLNAGTGSGSGEALAVVASTDSSTDWRVFKLNFDGSSADFTSVQLLAIVESNATLANASPIFGV